MCPSAAPEGLTPIQAASKHYWNSTGVPLTYPSHNIVLIIGAHRPSNIMPVCSIDSDRVKEGPGEGVRGGSEVGGHTFAKLPFVI